MPASLCASWWGGKRMKLACSREILRFPSWELDSCVSICSKRSSLLLELFSPLQNRITLLPAFSKTRLTAIHLSKCFFLGVAGAICLAPFSRTFPSDFFPQWPMPFQFASAASHRCETANCSLCKIRRLFVIQLEVLRLWMRGETAASLRLCLHIVWRQAGVLPACALNWPGVSEIQVDGMMWSNKSCWGHSVCYWAESCVGVVLGVRASV